MKKIIYLSLLGIFSVLSVSAQQFGVSAELRPRFENRHGYKTLIDKNVDGANFISQRSRLTFNFEQDKIRLKMSLQNVRVWGDVSTLSTKDNANSLHEAWAEALLSKKFSVKIGRQEIVYDDQRIFGSVNWAQGARSHDAAILKYNPNKNNRLDVGFALNADGENLTDQLYSNAAGYKNFQYAWYHGNFNNFGISLLALNTGIEYSNIQNNNTIDYMQTLGTRLTYNLGKLKVNASTYFQTGKKTDNKVSASYYAGNLSYQTTANLNLAAGIEYLSGKSTNDASTDIKSFAPLFGTNHKFNGWMDYFYVGSFNNSVGLTDINMTLLYKMDKFSAKLMPHFFSSAANVYNNGVKMSSNLGTELDLNLGYKVAKNIKFNAGYSMMFATDTLEALKGGDKDANNSWAWVMVTFNPKLFSSSAK